MPSCTLYSDKANMAKHVICMSLLFSYHAYSIQSCTVSSFQPRNNYALLNLSYHCLKAKTERMNICPAAFPQLNSSMRWDRVMAMVIWGCSIIASKCTELTFFVLGCKALLTDYNSQIILDRIDPAVIDLTV